MPVYMAAKANILWAFHSREQPGSLAAVAMQSEDNKDPSNSTVAAMKGTYYSL
jgi:hypothetical protein